MKSKNNNLLGFGSLFISALTFGSFGIWIRLLNKEIGSFEQIVLRNLFALIFTIIAILKLKVNLNKIKLVNKGKLIAFTIVVPLAVILYVFAILGTKISVATFSFYAGTIAASWIFGITIFKEKIDIYGLTSIIFVAIGLVFLIYPFSLENLNFGFMLGLLSGVVDSVGHVFRKDLGNKLDKFVLVLLTAVGGVLVSGAMILFGGRTLTFVADLSLSTWLVAAIFGFLLVAVNFLIILGFQNFNLGLGTIVLSAELFFASLFGFLIFAERPTTTELIAGIFILIASIIPNIPALLTRKN